MYIGLNGTVRVKIMKSIPEKVWVALGTATGTDGVVCCAVPTQRRRPQSSSAPGFEDTWPGHVMSPPGTLVPWTAHSPTQTCDEGGDAERAVRKPCA